jgi:ABC-type uncharacterized transport system permease subunit
MEILTYALTALGYAALAFYFWRTRWTARAATAQTAALPPLAEHALLFLPLAAHAVLLGRSIFATDGMHLGFGNAISAILWLTVLIYWTGNFFYRLEGLQALVLPLAAVAVLLGALSPPEQALANSNLVAFKMHLIIAMLAYSLLTIASLHVLLMALLEKRLHDGSVTNTLQKLPPLLTMEALLFRIIWAGFILLTLTLGSGVFFSEEIFAKAAPLNHKTVFGFVSWLIFGALLLGRHVYGWRGRIAVRWTLAGFLTLVLAYIGSKFVLEVVLGR